MPRLTPFHNVPDVSVAFRRDSSDVVDYVVRLGGARPEKDTLEDDVRSFVMFSLRQLLNLGTHPLAVASSTLMAGLDVSSSARAAPLSGVLQVWQSSVGEDVQAPSFRLSEGTSREMARGFTGDIHWRGSYDLTYVIKSWGFGIVPRDRDYYAAASVVLLLEHLGAKHSADPRALLALRRASALCAASFQAGLSPRADWLSVGASIVDAAMST